MNRRIRIVWTSKLTSRLFAPQDRIYAPTDPLTAKCSDTAYQWNELQRRRSPSRSKNRGSCSPSGAARSAWKTQNPSSTPQLRRILLPSSVGLRTSTAAARPSASAGARAPIWARWSLRASISTSPAWAARARPPAPGSSSAAPLLGSPWTKNRQYPTPSTQNPKFKKTQMVFQRDLENPDGISERLKKPRWWSWRLEQKRWDH